VAREFGWQFEAWAVFSNHYHFVAHTPEGEQNAESLAAMLSKLHEKTANAISSLKYRYQMAGAVKLGGASKSSWTRADDEGTFVGVDAGSYIVFDLTTTVPTAGCDTAKLYVPVRADGTWETVQALGSQGCFGPPVLLNFALISANNNG